MSDPFLSTEHGSSCAREVTPDISIDICPACDEPIPFTLTPKALEALRAYTS